VSYSDVSDGEDVAGAPPDRRSSLIVAALIAWLLIFGAAALIAPALVSVTLSVLVPGALVILAATLIGRGWGATLVGLALVAILALGALHALRNTLRSPRVDPFDPTLATTEEEARRMCADTGMHGMAVVLGTEATVEAVVDRLAAMHAEERRDAIERGCRDGLTS
jgi:hypothetical protein